MSEFLELLHAALDDRYRLERELGRGGAAVVYLARDVKHGRRVAVKVMRPDLAATLGADRFLREINIAANLSHPHILPVLDSGRAGDFLFYVMPFLEGETLRTRMARRGPLTFEETLRVLHDVFDALHHAHNRGIVHRDVKPENVLLSGRHALVMDFGVAKALSDAASEQESDTKGIALGTPAYMAPEQAAADPNIDHRADLYSVGILAYEMLAGHPPFHGGSARAVLTSQITQPPMPVTQHRPDVPAGLADLTMRCLEKKPEARFQTSDDALQYLEVRITPSRGSGAFTTTAVMAAMARRGRGVLASLSVVAIVLLVASGWFLGTLRTPTVPERPLIVVLPFENLGPAEDEYFANGISDAITARLARLGSLGVISRSSAMQYRGTDLTAQEIARELGVNYILEGTIQRERPSDPSSKLRVIPQLVRGSDDTHLWANVYDEEMTEVFRVQSEIAERVAGALNVTLRESERLLLAARPTAVLEAYELYLRGHDYLVGNVGSGDANARRIAIELLEQAVALDSSFALAYAELSLAHMWLFHYFVDPSDERLAAAKEAVDRALALEPDLPTAHLARGHYYFWGQTPNPQRALEEFQHVADREPNNAQARMLIATLQAVRGEWDLALRNASLAVELEPREPDWLEDAGRMNLYARQYGAAERYLDRAVALAPDLTGAYQAKIALYLRWAGDLDKSREVVAEMQSRVTPGEVAQALLESARVLVVSGEYDEIFEQLSPASIAGRFPFDYFHVKAEFFRLRGRSALARTYYDSLRVAVQAVPRARAGSDVVHMFLGRAFAGLGQRADALRQARAMEGLVAESTDALRTTSMRAALVWIYAMVGEDDDALDHLEHLLATPSPFSVPYLRVEEMPGSVRRHSRFQELLRASTEDIVAD
jgi:serine/threonine-protein kinase